MRRSNLIRAVTSLIVVLLVFAVYSIAVVPVIEPVIAQPPQHVTSDSDRTIATSEFSREIAQLFGDDDWETESPRVLRDDKRKMALLFKTYEIGSDGGVIISPCTVVYGSAERSSGNGKAPMILQAPDGATIFFDAPIDLSTAKAGQLVSGQLRGNVTISRAADATGHGELMVKTSNVQITNEGLMAPNEFNFEYEKSSGSGHNLIVRVDKVRNGKKATFDIIQSIELVTLHNLYLSPETADPLDTSANDSADSKSKNIPTQVTCDGPCRIDLRRNTLSFEDNVDLRRLNPNAADDVLKCNQLTIFFEKQRTAETANRVDRAPSFEVERVLATGNPVILSAPSRFAYLRGSRLEYDLDTRKFRMTSATQSSFRHVDETSEHRLFAPRIVYTATAEDQIGSLAASGPGTYHGTDIEKNQNLVLKWENELSLSPVKHFHLLSIDGHVDAQLGDNGHVQAGHVDIWLEPSPKLPRMGKPAGKDDSTISLRPHLVRANGQVDFDSDELTAQCDNLETKFTHLMGSDLAGSDSTPPRDRKNARIYNAGIQNRVRQNSRGRFTSTELAEPAESEPRRADDSELGLDSKLSRRDQKMQLTGSKIDIAITMVGPSIRAIDQVDVKGNARFRELATSTTQTQPLAVDANSFRLTNPAALNATVQAIGSPTIISTGGFQVEATNVHVDKEKNLIWSTGSGTATMPIRQNVQGKPLDVPAEAKITWTRSMEFDGVLIKLTGNALVQAPDFQLESDNLQARLDRRIDFSEKRSGKPNIAQITAQENVIGLFETRELGRLMSSTFMRVPNVTFNTLNGDISVDGAGQIMMTKRGFNESGGLVPISRNQPEQAAVRPEPKDDRLTFLQIDFQSDVRGNVEQRILAFNRDIRTIYGPVYDWNQKINPNSEPQENDILLSCDKLVVAQGRPGNEGTRPLDMRALGNVFVEGQAFQATGDRVTYDQSKDMLILRGNGQTDAKIRYRKDNKSATIDKSASEFKFYPGKREAVFNEFRSLEFRTIGR